MITRPTASNDVQTGETHDGDSAWNRPPAARVMGWAMLFCAALLLLAGAYRSQANMITSGMLFLAFGLILAPDALKKGWPIRLGLAALAVIGAVYTFLI